MFLPPPPLPPFLFSLSAVLPNFAVELSLLVMFPSPSVSLVRPLIVVSDVAVSVAALVFAIHFAPKDEVRQSMAAPRTARSCGTDDGAASSLALPLSLRALSFSSAAACPARQPQQYTLNVLIDSGEWGPVKQGKSCRVIVAP